MPTSDWTEDQMGNAMRWGTCLICGAPRESYLVQFVEHFENGDMVVYTAGIRCSEDDAHGEGGWGLAE